MIGNVSLWSGCVTYSMYASSSTTRTSLGTFARKARNAASGMTTPVGLFGLHTQTIEVWSSIAANIASRSCAPS